MSHAHAAPRFDPRKIITPENFSVAPHLLGLPVASPTRRLVAILIDLLLCALLAHSGAVFFAVAAAVAFFWFAGRKLGNGGTFFGKTARASFRGAGALMLFIAALSLWHGAQHTLDRVTGGSGDGDAPAARMSVNGGGAHATTNVSAGAVAGFTMQMIAVENARDSAQAFRAARGLVARMRAIHMTDAQIRETLNGTAQGAAKPFVAAALRSAAPAAPASADAAANDGGDDDDATARGRDTLAAAYVAAVRTGDSTRADDLRPKLATTFAHEQLSDLQGQVNDLQASNEELKKEKEKAENRGLLATLLGVLDDLGIGFGWTGLYFTALTALWKGQTPGKKLLGIRVVRLEGEPMTLWASFERFGGYAAGLFTGLSGYAQVYWDRNRQAIQDKISETVVIREPAGFVLPVAHPHPRAAPAWAGAPAPYPPAGPPGYGGPGAPYGAQQNPAPPAWQAPQGGPPYPRG